MVNKGRRKFVSFLFSWLTDRRRTFEPMSRDINRERTRKIRQTNLFVDPSRFRSTFNMEEKLIDRTSTSPDSVLSDFSSHESTMNHPSKDVPSSSSSYSMSVLPPLRSSYTMANLDHPNYFLDDFQSTRWSVDGSERRIETNFLFRPSTHHDQLNAETDLNKSASSSSAAAATYLVNDFL